MDLTNEWQQRRYVKSDGQLAAKPNPVRKSKEPDEEMYVPSNLELLLDEALVVNKDSGW